MCFYKYHPEPVAHASFNTNDCLNPPLCLLLNVRMFIVIGISVHYCNVFYLEFASLLLTNLQDHNLRTECIFGGVSEGC